METRNISQELEVIIHSKRIPNALIFEADGSETELKISLEFAKKILLSNKTNPVIQNKIIKDKLNSDILYIGPSNIVKEIMHDNLSFRSFYISSSSNCDIKAEIQKLPLKESSVDCVVLIHSLETNKNPHAAFREIDRVLTEDGEIILVSFNKMSLEPLFFWGHNAKGYVMGKQCLSNWFPSLFVVEEKINDKTC